MVNEDIPYARMHYYRSLVYKHCYLDRFGHSVLDLRDVAGGSCGNSCNPRIPHRIYRQRGDIHQPPRHLYTLRIRHIQKETKKRLEYGMPNLDHWLHHPRKPVFNLNNI